MTAERATIEFFFDVGSPYTYLAATQVRAVAQRAEAELRWRPFLLGGVFKATGNQPPASLAARGRWMFQDLVRWAARYGVPFRFPSELFPLNTLAPQRALVAADRVAADRVPGFADALFRAYWVESRDITTNDAIVELAGEAGLDGQAILAATADPIVKETLKAATAEAVERGAFGSPTLFVGDAMYFGNDRLDMLEERARGD